MIQAPGVVAIISYPQNVEIAEYFCSILELKISLYLYSFILFRHLGILVKKQISKLLSVISFNFLWSYFTNVGNKLERLPLADLSSLS
jgi:hypothetical protein